LSGDVAASRSHFLLLALVAFVIVAAGAAAGIWVAWKRWRSTPPAPSASSDRPDTEPQDAGALDALADSKPVPDVAVDTAPRPEPTTVAEQRAAMLDALRTELDATEQEIAAVRKIFDASPIIGQGNPKKTVHPMTRAQCREIRTRAGLLDPDPAPCGKANMVPIDGMDGGSVRTCIDQYEFPNIACEYPLVHVTAREAALLCEALGKRLCDAHEWEGACAGALLGPEQDYTWQYSRGTRTLYHNRDRQIVWAYGPTKNHALCATGSTKNRTCTGGFADCGSNTYPAGAFPECASKFGVYDQHGNAAEHMNLALERTEMTSRGGHGYTEMKGSWFFFGTYEAHEDDCRWRAPSWHETKVMEVNSHSNYHLGFRCCKGASPDAGSH
jgi:formylglycine-generating enzyme